MLTSAAKQLEEAGYAVSFQQVDVASREPVKALADKVASLGSVMNVVNKACVFAEHGTCEARALRSIPMGSAVVSEEFEQVIAQGGSGLIVSSMARHTRPSLPNEQDHAVLMSCWRSRSWARKGF